MRAPNRAEKESPTSLSAGPNSFRSWMITAGVVAVSALLTVFLWWSLDRRNNNTATTNEAAQKVAESRLSHPNAVDIDPNAPGAASVSVQKLQKGSGPSAVSVTGMIEPNQQELQQITPLVSGRVKSVSAVLGDYVTKGTVLVTIDSPQVLNCMVSCMKPKLV